MHKSSIKANSSETLEIYSDDEAAKSYSKLSSMVQGRWLEILHCLDVGCGTGNVTLLQRKSELMVSWLGLTQTSTE